MVFYGYFCSAVLGLPFTHKTCQTQLTSPQGKSFTHEPQRRIALPHQLVPRGWVTATPEIATYARYQAYRVSQLVRWVNAFFFA